MRRILALSLAQPVAVLGLTVAFAIAGAIAFWHLPIEAFPELADPQVQVITLFPGHAAEEVERQVTLPVEQQMNGLPGLVRMHSFSIFGLSFVVLTFDDGTDLYFARQQVNERLRRSTRRTGSSRRSGRSPRRPARSTATRWSARATRRCSCG